jgi:RNA polymerase sigma-70 factor (ECF subfamily)
MGIFRKNYSEVSDEELMQNIRQGNTGAFDELYRRYNRRLLLYFYRMLGGDSEKAQDFLQDLFLKIFEKNNLFRNEARFSSWIFTVAHNMCKNEYRWLSVRKIITATII